MATDARPSPGTNTSSGNTELADKCHQNRPVPSPALIGDHPHSRTSASIGGSKISCLVRPVDLTEKISGNNVPLVASYARNV